MKYKSNAKYKKPVESGTVFEGKLGKVNICVHRLIGLDRWYLNCNLLGITDVPLESSALMPAIEEAQRIVKQYLDMVNRDFNMILNSEIEISI